MHKPIHSRPSLRAERSWRNLRDRPQYALLLLSFLLAGCLPFSCGKKQSRELFPTDSLSRVYASLVPVDTLEVVDQLRPESPELTYPNSLGYAPGGILWTGDLSNHVLTGFTVSGVVFGSYLFEELKYPYIAGFQGDSLIVFTPESPRIVHIVNGEIVRTVRVPDDRSHESGNRYAMSFDGGYFYKVIGKEFGGYIARLDRSGNETARWILPGEFWRYAGALRMWSDSLLSLSGYLPQVHVVSETSPAQSSDRSPDPSSDRSSGLDSLKLYGFDSPMLSRTRLFQLDELDQPPLLSASARAVGNRLFVLNMRPGWLRVDVYNRSGELQHILTEPNPEFNTEYFPTDLAVRIVQEGVGKKVAVEGTLYELSVSVYKPEPRIDRFRWRELRSRE